MASGRLRASRADGQGRSVAAAASAAPPATWAPAASGGLARSITASRPRGTSGLVIGIAAACLVMGIVLTIAVMKFMR